MSISKLLVEGRGDQTFFRALLDQIGLSSVEVYPPRAQGAKGDGADNLIFILPELLKEISRDADSKLGIILDADYPRKQQGNSFGFQARLKKAAEKIKEHGYIASVVTGHPKLQGEIFTSPDGLSSIGLWIMPDHSSDGMIEDFWIDCISETRKNLLTDHIDTAITKLRSDEQLEEQKILFSPTHLSKVRFETWLMWQKKPNSKKNPDCRDLTPACAYTEHWLDPGHANIQALTHWLQKVFQ